MSMLMDLKQIPMYIHWNSINVHAEVGHADLASRAVLMETILSRTGRYLGNHELQPLVKCSISVQREKV